MKPVDFLYGIHNHQPVGNFEHVFEEAYETCYRPQLEILRRHPNVKAAYHHSGPLLEWIEKRRPDYFEMIGEMVDGGQLELLSGGFYEPILSVIPKDDAIGQIVMMNEYLTKRFGYAPTGMWTAERIWDPELPQIASAAGISFTLLDDTHFYYTGMSPEDRYGYYVTEKGGETLAIFPIDKAMRYSIPFKSGDENVDYFRSLQGNEKVDCVTYGDDGEKYGVWPDTYEWVYEKGWLDGFYRAIEENPEVVRTIHYAEALRLHAPKGRIYLPPASYEEMMEWTLPADAANTFHDAVVSIEEMGKADEWKPFIRGGLWNNFQTKYDESNRMHKKMLAVSAKVGATDEPDARRELYRGQCNCAYWHGMFGGLYLNYLRHGVYESLIKAERIADEAAHGGKPFLAVDRFDYDKDTGDDLVMANRSLLAVVDPDDGGTLLELDYRPADFCLTNTLTRQKEAYHAKLLDMDEGDETGDAPASIHDMVRVKEEGLVDWLVYDKNVRRTFTDRFLPAGTDMASYVANDYEEQGDFADALFDIESETNDGKKATVTLSRVGVVAGSEIAMTKRFSMNRDDSSLTVDYQLVHEGEGELTVKVATELNMTLLAVDADDRYWTGGSAGSNRPKLKETLEDDGVTAVGMRDDFFGMNVEVTGDQPATAWRFPVYTVSQSEAGFERTYQGSCMALVRSITLQPGVPARWSLTLSVNDTKERQ